MMFPGCDYNFIIMSIIENKMLPIPLKYTYPTIMEFDFKNERYTKLIYIPEEGRWILKCNLRRFLKLRKLDYIVWKCRWFYNKIVDYGSDSWIDYKILEEYPDCYPHTVDYIKEELRKDSKFKCNSSIIVKSDFIDQYFLSRELLGKRIFNYDFSELPNIIKSHTEKVKILINDINPNTGKPFGEYHTSFRRFITEGKDFKELINAYMASEFNRMTNENFIKKSRAIFGNKFEYLSQYIDYNTPILLRCNDCGSIFEVKPTNHLNSMFGGCSICSRKSASEKLRISENEFLERAIDIHGDKYNYDKVIEEHQINNINSKIDIYCNACGEYFSQTVRDHIYSGAGCPRCGRLLTGLKNRTSEDIIISRLINEFGNMYDYSKVNYTGNKNPITLICPKHGEFTIIPTHIGRSSGCPNCNCKSMGSMYIHRWIIDNSLTESSQREKTFYDIEGRNSNIVRCDFIIIYNNIKFWIEYNGIQHYEELCFFNSSHEDFISQVKRDQNVRDYCKNNFYTYIEIPYIYNTYEKVKDLLDRVILGGEDINTIIDYQSLYKL